MTPKLISNMLHPLFHLSFSLPSHTHMQGCQCNMEDWQRILQVRSLVLSQQEELRGWIKFSTICRKGGKMSLSERTLLTLLNHDSECSEIEPLSCKYPQVGTVVVIIVIVELYFKY